MKTTSSTEAAACDTQTLARSILIPTQFSCIHAYGIFHLSGLPPGKLTGKLSPDALAFVMPGRRNDVRNSDGRPMQILFKQHVFQNRSRPWFQIGGQPSVPKNTVFGRVHKRVSQRQYGLQRDVLAKGCARQSSFPLLHSSRTRVECWK